MYYHNFSTFHAQCFFSLFISMKIFDSLSLSGTMTWSEVLALYFKKFKFRVQSALFLCLVEIGPDSWVENANMKRWWQHRQRWRRRDRRWRRPTADQFWSEKFIRASCSNELKTHKQKQKRRKRIEPNMKIKRNKNDINRKPRSNNKDILLTFLINSPTSLDLCMGYDSYLSLLSLLGKSKPGLYGLWSLLDCVSLTNCL